MRELRELLRGDSNSVPLDVAALQIASIETPSLSIEPWLVLLDSHATEFGQRVNRQTSGEEFIRLLNEYLFEELGFQGNSANYYEPANSCLDAVLMRRVGIPITLSLVYMDIGRRLGRQIYGVGLPGHFLVACDEPDYKGYIDAFHSGNALSDEECYELAREATGMALADDPEMLRPVPKRQICIRMLNNLRAIYFQRRDHSKAIQVLDLLLEALPQSAEEYKQRAVCLAQVSKFAEAERDFETYLRLAPDASDRRLVAAELDRIRRIIALQD